MHIYDTWDGSTAMYLSTTRLRYQWHVQFRYDESENDSKGYIELDDHLLSEETSLRTHLKEEIICLTFLEQKQAAILAYLYEQNRYSYYDPLSQSLVIFQKHLPFYLQGVKERKESTYAYRLCIGTLQTTTGDVEQLEKAATSYIQRFMKRERIRAISEGRR